MLSFTVFFFKDAAVVARIFSAEAFSHNALYIAFNACDNSNLQGVGKTISGPVHTGRESKFAWKPFDVTCKLRERFHWPQWVLLFAYTCCQVLCVLFELGLIYFPTHQTLERTQNAFCVKFWTMPEWCAWAPFTQDAKADLRANLHANTLMLLATCVNTSIYCSVFHNLHASCVNGALQKSKTRRSASPSVTWFGEHDAPWRTWEIITPPGEQS